LFENLKIISKNKNSQQPNGTLKHDPKRGFQVGTNKSPILRVQYHKIGAFTQFACPEL
jgi:hypothetical protein